MSENSKIASVLKRATKKLSKEMAGHAFSEPVAYVYNPLEYAWASHKRYLENYAAARKRVLFLGMNPGPFGMAQTGIPFGEIEAVRAWMGIEEPVQKPKHEHPKRPVEGFACNRSEVSGRRLWGLFRERFGDAPSFFREHYVSNYCPLLFLNERGSNVTPDKIQASELESVYESCDAFLQRLINTLQPEFAVGIGNFAYKKLKTLLASSFDIRISKILHPSPASPAANRGWAEAATRQLAASGVWE